MHAKTQTETPSLEPNLAGEDKERVYEHSLASWACTILNDVFARPEWILTQKRNRILAQEKTDLVVEKKRDDRLPKT